MWSVDDVFLFDSAAVVTEAGPELWPTPSGQ